MKFLKENWFYLMIGVSIVVFSFSFLVYVFIEKKCPEKDYPEPGIEVFKEGWSKSDKFWFKEGCMQALKVNAVYINNVITQDDIRNVCECYLTETINVYPDNKDVPPAKSKELNEIAIECMNTFKK